MKFYILFFGLIAQFALDHTRDGVATDVQRAVLVQAPNHKARLVIPEWSLVDPNEAKTFLNGTRITDPDDSSLHYWVWDIRTRHLIFHMPAAGLSTPDPDIPKLTEITDAKKPHANVIQARFLGSTHIRGYVDYTGGELHGIFETDEFTWEPGGVGGCHPAAEGTERIGTTGVLYIADTASTDKPFLEDKASKDVLRLKPDAIVLIGNCPTHGHAQSKDYKENLFLMENPNCMTQVPEQTAMSRTTHIPSMFTPLVAVITPQIERVLGSIRNPECTNTQYP